ncbi:hypothetical protein SOCE26_095860 [Sorangium cellulosum]|uniref:Uncharacterized protein n=1 Tax=Sorangium cellulosum TaxID=56 RepID=A0A2L0F9D2_SORCE|nr:hypothetical protein [Sorangium cellulosum]AUX48059.1 hypothetical protein SOCE26_095860 [Sorangium cellulosum]
MRPRDHGGGSALIAKIDRRPGRPRAWPLAALALALALLGCGGAPAGAARPTAWNAPPEGQQGLTSGTQAERYFPLVDGHIYHYATLSDAGGEGLLVARVHRADARRGELRFPSGVKRFEFTPEGVIRSDTGVFVLKEPISPGTTWTGEHGGRARIEAVGASVEVPAGRFDGCVQTVEERLGDRPARYVSTFCPDVGVVAIEATSGASYEKAELKSYAPPVDMGPDGVRRTPAEPPAGAASPP